jgi:Holliday junction resolvase
MERKLQSEIIKWLKSQGAYVIKPRSGPGVPVGCPDIICLYKNRWCVIEVKADEHAKMQPGQQSTLDFLGRDNAYVYKVWPEKWPLIQTHLLTGFF